MKLVDAHCHLESEYFRDNLDSIISDARNAGVIRLITSSITPGQWELSRSIAGRYDEVEFAIGVHPWYISGSDIPLLEGLYGAKEMGAVAIGEIGIDKKVAGPGFETQLAVFERQLEIARDIDLPVILHCRGAFNELIVSFKKIGLPKSGGIIHNFSGSVELAKDLVKHGAAFSMGGTLTYRHSNKRKKVLEYIYPDYFLLETDSPDIPPVEQYGKPNVPANILFNLRGAAGMLQVPEADVALATTKNAARIFKLAL